MKLLEYPYVIITILVVSFIILALVGIIFAIRGMKAAKGKEEKDFTTLGKLESSFEKSGRLREYRSVFFVSIALDDFRSLRSEAKTQSVYSEIKSILLSAFSGADESAVAVQPDKSVIAFNNWNMYTTRVKIDACLSELSRMLTLKGALNIIDVRVGIYYALGTEVTFDDAVTRAKKACMHAKNEKVPFVEWNVGNGKALDKKIKIENNIENEIDNNRFFLEYQPILDAKTKGIIGAEVLSRLKSESDGILSPGSFLSAVDSVGINEKFDYYIFEKNCKWISNDKKNREGYIYTINFSRSTLCDPDFAERIIGIAEKYSLNFSCLAVEILEDRSLSSDARKQMMANLSILKEKGIAVLLDDFGSGYTTFGDLQSLDVYIVKIDKSITQNSVTETGYIILKNIITTAKDLGFKTLCEGVETKEQEEAAISAGCDMLQGYYYYKPMPVAMLERIFYKS